MGEAETGRAAACEEMRWGSEALDVFMHDISDHRRGARRRGEPISNDSSRDKIGRHDGRPMAQGAKGNTSKGKGRGRASRGKGKAKANSKAKGKGELPRPGTPVAGGGR